MNKSTLLYTLQVCIEFNVICLAERQSEQELTDWRIDRPTVSLVRVIRFIISDVRLARSVAFEYGSRSQACQIPDRT